MPDPLTILTIIALFSDGSSDAGVFPMPDMDYCLKAAERMEKSVYEYDEHAEVIYFCNEAFPEEI